MRSAVLDKALVTYIYGLSLLPETRCFTSTADNADIRLPHLKQR